MFAAFTIVSRNHLHRARVVMKSVAEAWPAARRYVFLADEIEGYFEPAAESFTVVSPRELGLANYRTLAFAMDALSLCCFLKPVGARFLVERAGGTKIVYFDSDTCLYSPPEAMLKVLADHPVVLTPHLLDRDQNRTTDTTTMASGAYNAGLFAVDSSPVARSFLGWWENNTRDSRRLRSSWAYDQGWLNLVPALFPEAALLRDPSYNVAFWNLHERQVSAGAPAGFSVNGRPLTVFHFSFFDRRRPGLLTGRLRTAFAAPNAAVLRLAADYGARLDAAGAAVCESWPYGFSRFLDGKPITAVHRAYFRERIVDLLPAGADPFDAGIKIRGNRGWKSLHRSADFGPRSLRAAKALLRKPLQS